MRDSKDKKDFLKDYDHGIDRSKKFCIVKYEVPRVIKSRYKFYYERYDEPRLLRLRQEYKLSEIIKNAKTELERFTLLRDWVRSQWTHGFDEDKAEDAKDGVSLLKDAKRGLEFSCGSYALLYIQCLLSLGYQARMVGISRKDSDFIRPDANTGHMLPEVWSDDFGKWIIMDPDINGHYEYKGEPLSAYEIRKFCIEDRWREINLIRGKSPFILTKKVPWYWTNGGIERVKKETEIFMRYNVVDYYYYISVLMGNDYTSLKKGYGLHWVDRFTPPRLVRSNVPIQHPYTQDINDLYWTLNRAEIKLKCLGKDNSHILPYLEVKLDTNTPNLKGFLVSIDEKEWEYKPAVFNWKLKKGDNTIKVKVVNKFGLEGPNSRVTVSYIL